MVCAQPDAGFHPHGQGDAHSSAPPEVTGDSNEGVPRPVHGPSPGGGKLLLGISHDRDGEAELSPFLYSNCPALAAQHTYIAKAAPQDTASCFVTI